MVFTLGVSYTGVRSAAADGAISTCNSGNLVTASLTIDGVAAQLNTSGGFALTVCRISSGDQQMYSVLVGLYDSGVLREELTSAYADKTFEVTFTPTAGDVPTTAEFYGKVTSFSASSPVVVAVQPAKNISLIQYGNHAECRGVEYTNAQCIALPASVDRAAVVLGQIRFDTSSRPSNYSKLAGATVSATANLYDFSLLGPCPTATSGFTGTDSGDGGSGKESTTLNIKLVGPHFKFDGSTLNSGALEVFIPQSTITSCFGGSSEQLANTAAVTRTEGNESKDVLKSLLTPINGLEYTTSFVNGGLKLSIPAVTFSQPTYKVVLKKKHHDYYCHYYNNNHHHYPRAGCGSYETDRRHLESCIAKVDGDRKMELWSEIQSECGAAECKKDSEIGYLQDRKDPGDMHNCSR